DDVRKWITQLPPGSGFLRLLNRLTVPWMSQKPSQLDQAILLQPKGRVPTVMRLPTSGIRFVFIVIR
ncbi:MAG: hypothetical protein AAB676_14805, partial [Verrucomicrobiota bacterium]